jgi:predicted aspartyl protease
VGLLLLSGHAAAASPDPTPDAVLADLPFLDGDERNRIFVDLAPEGSRRPLRLLLDTGASHTVMTPLAARALGVSVRRLKRDPYRKKTRLGRDLLFYVDTRSSDNGSRTGWEYGLLGGNFLDDYVVEFDFVKRRVRFIDPGRFEVPEQVETEDETVLPLAITTTRPAFDVTVNGATFPALLDTGAPLGFMLSGKLADRAGVESAPNDLFEFGTVMGVVDSRLGATDRLVVGRFDFGAVPTVVLPNGWFNQGLPDAAVVGYDLLSQFLVRIDYPRKRLWLKRRPDWRITFGGDPWPGVAAPPPASP